MEQLFIAACHKNCKTEKSSSSGGAFTALTDEWFLKYGEKAVVYGCVLDENLKAKHLRAVTSNDRDKMRGSKYIQSDISGVFEQVADDLKNGNMVLFSGTPCQIAALLKFVDKLPQKNNLLTVDVICHGVGSNEFFADYIAYLENKYKSNVVSCNFRGKSRAGSSTSMEIEFSNGKKYVASSTRFDWFYSVYYKNYIINAGCFSCKFAKIQRCADITIGDMRRKNLGHDTKYKSLIIVNTEKGKALTDLALKNMEWVATAEAEIDQPHLYKPSVKPNDYEQFWGVYNQKGYLAAQKYVGNNTVLGKTKAVIVDIINFFHLSGLIKKIKHIIKN